MDIGCFFINVPMDFQVNFTIDGGEHQPAINDYDGSAARHLLEQFGDIVGMRAYATVGLKLIDASRRNRAVNTVSPDAEPQPMFAQRIVWPRQNTSFYGFAFTLHFFLNGFGNVPGRIFLFHDDFETPRRGGPVLASQSH